MGKSGLCALFGAALAAAAFAAPASASNLLTNGSFETGDFSGWTTGGNFEFTQVVTGPFFVTPSFSYPGAQDGIWYVTAGPVGSDGTLSQTFSDSAGQQLQISGWVAAIGDDPSDFSLMFNTTTLYSATDPNTGGAWTQGTFNVTGTGSDTVTIAFRDDPNYIALDNFSVTPVNATPLPAALPLFASGIGGLGLLGWRRRKKARALAA